MNSKIQIVATIGPVTKEKEMIRNLIEHGVDAVRLNFSWGTYEEHLDYIKNVREVAVETGKRIPIIQDLSGPRLQSEDGHKFDINIENLITLKDLKDLEFGVKNNVDYIAMSYVGSSGDVELLRKEVKKFDKVIPIIAKIERKIAVENIDEIIEASDAIMIARGDLGNEIPLEQIPFVEKEIIEKCKIAGKPVIVATQVLLSMTENPFPTRAEMTDIAYAVMSGADALMLSDETAMGAYPLEAVMMMEKGIKEAEEHTKDLKINSL